ncbi:hypothetical protein L6452_05256 [Arctium lappa]|uniref:Uncharacterized protein n=1 Tax=Arctium lappa TaxID=4217 RepID=A0ACB9EGJ2_ARCLA|nr:hypothetical protein L6452_05256 [Arctium lappa]
MEKPLRPRTSTSRTELSSVTSVTMSFIGSFETCSLVVREARASMGLLDDAMFEIKCETGKAVSTRETACCRSTGCRHRLSAQKVPERLEHRLPEDRKPEHRQAGNTGKLETQAAEKLVEEKSPVCFQSKNIEGFRERIASCKLEMLQRKLI